MYQYTPFDSEFVKARSAQYRDQLERYLAGKLGDDEFRPLRLQNGWYVQRYAPMLRVAVPYGELNSAQLRVLSHIARDYDTPKPEVLATAQTTQDKISGTAAVPIDAPKLVTNCGHFTTRQNVQFNWIPLEKSADVMDLLASVNMHGIQTSGNCIRNITSDERAGIAVDEDVDPRPYAEMLRQWSTLHPEFAYLPRKFKIAITGATEDRAAIEWHDIGLRLLRDDEGQVGFKIYVGGGMGRTPMTGQVIREFLPWNHIINYLEAVVRVYNNWGRRDNIYKARIKILVKAEGQRYFDEVNEEFDRILESGAHHTIPQTELDRVSAYFVLPPVDVVSDEAQEKAEQALLAQARADKEFTRWLQQNVTSHQNPGLRVVTLSFKRLGQAPGDATAGQLATAADLADKFSSGEVRVNHDQNLVLPWVRIDQLADLYQAAKAAGFARANVHLLTDMIACPGGDYCALANARSLPIAAAITERYEDLDELFDLGEIDLHISGCINSCGHHHSGHIGILGVDKDGQEWYQVTLGGSDGSFLSGPAKAGKVVGPSFAAAEVVDVVEAVLDTYRDKREGHETFARTLNRVGFDVFKAAANSARNTTARSE
ncbi:MAG: nitrite reductase [Burkholderiales bacterium 35-55-47]|jgi:sulfite reductase (NADPH) hemoprotein beta-component|uniref:nitrite/sulfite reductase n=1 Tax=Limnohabitans sp. TaxID=1907725 RepID=UPI000BD78E32|nr:nitrite/sulfite reductase [Limnohabitans sp.]OYY18801.1 MAG: nitrite reductase [Burkholderiales bacterium 35-55-47]OYZ73619.1 MAG: nitrite reductase [Burkholderiales bacterium 24-55-52]OZB00765.1 MAG: nitrite reductase [Burkholderiales bacterium 39-55-53]HQR85473.1 nitrite/sulfite reductase [Limnohabitans sp.]HQS26610.1 nitrite/sulfite reductase [Limnohabitans sp.]